jgi:hypothetical protein
MKEGINETVNRRSTMDFIPHIVKAEYIKDYIIEVTFNDGAMKIVNLETYTKKGGIFSELKSKG